MEQDAYRIIAGLYDRVCEPAAKILRNIGLTIFPPHENIAMLDVGCGTGTQLSLYQKPGCRLVGIDSSPAMLAAARRKLGAAAELHQADAAHMSFSAGTFDLVTMVFVLHEMPPGMRSAVLMECRRVVKPDGRIMLIDYHPGPFPFLMGWVWHLVITLMETGAGRRHYGNYRDFIARGGLEPLVTGQHFKVQKRFVTEHGVTAIYLISAGC
jgi:ubiquinone/menaquinone biosynthesis C-methylase UbiE